MTDRIERMASELLRRLMVEDGLSTGERCGVGAWWAWFGGVKVKGERKGLNKKVPDPLSFPLKL